jgi:hypothetical protein
MARFCHRCGRPASGGAPAAGRPATTTSGTPWVIAAAIIVLAIGAIIYNVSRGGSAGAPPAPDMPNVGQQPAAPFATPGSATPGSAMPGGPAPDISRMSPRERFDRLFNRIMAAAERGDSTTVVTFTPMALGAYSQLDTVDADARYHAAVLHTQVGNLAAAQALADTILRADPNHLLGFVVRGTVARLQRDQRAEAQAYKNFLAHYDEEMQTKQVEYLDHKPVLEEFRKQASGGR